MNMPFERRDGPTDLLGPSCTQVGEIARPRMVVRRYRIKKADFLCECSDRTQDCSGTLMADELPRS